MRLLIRLERRDGACVETRHEIADHAIFGWPAFVSQVLRPAFEGLKNLGTGRVMGFLGFEDGTVAYSDYSRETRQKSQYAAEIDSLRQQLKLSREETAAIQKIADGRQYEISQLKKETTELKAKLKKAFFFPDFPFAPFPPPPFPLSGAALRFSTVNDPFSFGPDVSGVQPGPTCECGSCKEQFKVERAEIAMKKAQDNREEKRLRYIAADQALADARTKVNKAFKARDEKQKDFQQASDEADKATSLYKSLQFERINWRRGDVIEVRKPTPYTRFANVPKHIVNNRTAANVEYRKALLNQGVNPDQPTVQEFEFFTDTYKIWNT